MKLGMYNVTNITLSLVRTTEELLERKVAVPVSTETLLYINPLKPSG
jgi:hypothetical protein